MRIFFFLFSFLYADISNLIEMINFLENKKVEFKPIERYNIFSNKKKILHLRNMEINNTLDSFNIKISAIFNNKILIDDKWYKVGDEIEGYKIVKIVNNNIVIFERNGKKYESMLHKDLIKVVK